MTWCLNSFHLCSHGCLSKESCLYYSLSNVRDKLSHPDQRKSPPRTIVVLLLKCMFSNSVMLLHFSVSPFLLSRQSGIGVFELVVGSVRTKWPQGQWVGPCAAGHLRIEVVQRWPNTEFHSTDPWDDLDSTLVLFFIGVGLNSYFTPCCSKQEKKYTYD